VHAVDIQEELKDPNVFNKMVSKYASMENSRISELAAKIAKVDGTIAAGT